MKTFLRFVIATIAFAPSLQADAAELQGEASYRGIISGVSPGFYGEVGIFLDNGWTCNGQPAVILQSSNPKYQEILAVLVSAQLTHATVAIYHPRANPVTNDKFCTISEAALGNNPYWS